MYSVTNKYGSEEFISKSLYFLDKFNNNKKRHIHCVKSTKSNDYNPESKVFYSGHDKIIIDLIINQGKPLVISKSDVERFELNDLKQFEKTNPSVRFMRQYEAINLMNEKRSESNSLFKWHLKIICNVFAYSSSEIKLLGYDKEIEKLINLISIL